MAAIDNPSTLAELQVVLGETLKENHASTAVATLLGRYLNAGLQDMHRERWSWAERRAVLVTHPGYADGSIALDIASRTVVAGTSTLWTTAVTGMSFTNVQVGGKFVFQGEVEPYTVAAVTGPTSATIESPYIGTTSLSGVTYQYYEDEYPLAADFFAVTSLRYFSDNLGITLMGPNEFDLAYSRNSRRQQPRHATIVDVAPSGSAERRQRVILGPAPDRTYQIPYRYQTTKLAVSSAGVAQDNLSAATDQPIVPLRYRLGVVYKAAEIWARDRLQKPDLAAQFKGEYETLVLRARTNRSPADDRPRLVPRVLYQRRARYPRVAGLRGMAGDRWDALED